MNYFGIKNSWAKKILLEKGRFRMVRRDTSELAYDCKRHMDLLEKIKRLSGNLAIRDWDIRGSGYPELAGLSETLYVKVNRFYGKRSTEEIRSKIKEVIRLYEDIKKNGNNAPIVVTSSGARLDGSHRAGALKFLGVKEMDAKEVYAPRFLVWIAGREVARRQMVYDKYRGKAVYAKGKRLGTVLYTDFVRKDPFSIMGTYYHVLDTGEIVNTRRCYLEE